MNDSNNNTSKIIIGIIIAILVIIVAVYAFKMLKNDTTGNNLTNDVNKMGQNVNNATQGIVNGTSDVVDSTINGTENAINDVANGTKNVVDGIIDFTITDNATVENNTKTNTSEKIRDDKKFENLTFKEVTLIGRDNSTTFTAKIKNNSTDDFKSKDVTITFFKKDGTTITTRNLNIPDIKSMDTTEVTVNMEEDVANAYDYTIE